MNFLRGARKSASSCLESLQFTVIRASIERESTGSNFWGVSRNENMHRMRTMARLHESLFRIQMEIQEYEAKYNTLRALAETSFRQKASESQQKDNFNKMRLVELQKKALSKSENILLFTLNGLEKKGYIQNINSIIQYTVKQYKMVQEEGLIDDSQHDSLVDAFDQITSNVAKSQDILETLDSQSWNIENDQETEEGCGENDSAFSKWRQQMMMMSATSNAMDAPYTVNHQNVEREPPTNAYVLQHTHEDSAQAPSRTNTVKLSSATAYAL